MEGFIPPSPPTFTPMATTNLGLAVNQVWSFISAYLYASCYLQILSFPSVSDRQIFLDRLSGFLVGPLKDWTAEQIKLKELMKTAYSKEQRDKALSKFFRAALTTVSETKLV